MTPLTHLKVLTVFDPPPVPDATAQEGAGVLSRFPSTESSTTLVECVPDSVPVIDELYGWVAKDLRVVTGVSGRAIKQLEVVKKLWNRGGAIFVGDKQH